MPTARPGSPAYVLATQIFSLLHPRDLLKVSWTTKAFRGVITDRSSKPIWKKSLASVDGLPPCPRDLSEPAYAALLFSPYCSVRDGLLVILIWSDSSGYNRDVPSHGHLWSGNFDGGFVNLALQTRTSHCPQNRRFGSIFPRQGRRLHRSLGCHRQERFTCSFQADSSPRDRRVFA